MATRNHRGSGKKPEGHKRYFYCRASTVILLVLIAYSSFVIIFQVVASACDCDDYSIAFSGSSFDGTDTTFLYDVQVCCGKLKHWLLEMPACVAEGTVSDAGTVSGGSDWDWKDLDGATELRGVMLKEDVGYVSGDCITRTFYVSLEGDWSTSNTQAGLNTKDLGACYKATTGPAHYVPVAQDDAYSTNEDTQLSIIATAGVLANDSDADGDSLTAVLDTATSAGTLTLNGAGSFTYTPNSNFNGIDTFTYHANAGTANSEVATVTISVTPVNDSPLASDDSAATPEDTPVGINVTVNDSDIDGTIDPTTVRITQQPVTGSASVSRLTGKVTYTPAAGYSGLDTFTYSVRDNSGATSNEASISVNVTMVFYTLTMQVSAGSGGATTPSAGVHEHRRSSVVDVGATAKSGYEFDHWEGDLSGNANPTSIAMVSDKTVRAVFVAMEPSLGVVMEASDTMASVGDTITYTYTVINTGNVVLTDVSATDDLLGAIDLEAATLAPGERTTGSAAYTIQEGDPPWPIVSVATARGISSEERAPTEASTTLTVLLVPSVEPAITMTATAEPTSAHVGEEIRYTYTVTNTGDVMVRDVSAIASLVGLIAFGASSLPPGGSTEGAASYVVQRSDLPGPLDNVATGAATDGFGLVATDQVTTTVIVAEELTSGDGASTPSYKPEVDVSKLACVGTAANRRGESIKLYDLGAVLGMAVPADFDDFVMTPDLGSIECEAGESLVAELALRRGDMKEHGWPAFYITQPDLAPSTGDEAGTECADGFSFASRSNENAYQLEITVGDCLPGRCHVWIVCAGKTVLVPILLIPKQ